MDSFWDRCLVWLMTYGWAVIVVFMAIGSLWYFGAFDKSRYTPVLNVSLNDSYHQGFVDGTQYGVNVSIQAMLHYAQNCSIVRINYSNQIFGFIDATCVIPVNRTVS